MKLSKRFFDGFDGLLSLLSSTKVVAIVIIIIIFVPTSFRFSANIEEGSDHVIAFVYFRPPSYFFNSLLFGIPVETFFFHHIEEFLLLFLGGEADFTTAHTATTNISTQYSIQIHDYITFVGSF